RATRRREELQELPLQGRDLDRRHIMLLRRLNRELQRLVLRREHGLQSLLDLGAVFRAGKNLLIAHAMLPFSAVFIAAHGGVERSTSMAPHRSSVRPSSYFTHP